MATIKVLPSGAFQIRVVSKLLPKPFYATFDSRAQAEAYSDHLRKLLAQGIVPKALIDEAATIRTAWPIARCIAEYVRAESLAVSEVKLLDTLRSRVGHLMTNDLNYDWAEVWIRAMKRDDTLSPSTIRHRHGALARCFDWVCRKHPEIMAQNPLRLLKRGFATYTSEDDKFVMLHGRTPKADIPRDRRLEEGEEARILNALAERPVERVFFILALETAMRMRECYTLDIEQVGFPKKTIHLDRSKNGDSRQVPLSTTVLAMLKAFIAGNAAAIRSRDGRLFPYWNGDQSVYVLDAVTVDVSLMFKDIFASARLADFRFHDLRHEATCRLYEKTTLSDILVARITGHRNLRMLQRYASLRGSDLAERLW